MICPRCANQDVRYFYPIDGKLYCRKCIAFGRVFVGETIPFKEVTYSNKANYYLGYTLTKEQQTMAQQLVEHYRQKKDSLVKAVCGAGKTEIVYEVIKYALNHNQRVCFTTPRTELTKELYQRIIEQFHGVEIVLVCGGHTLQIDGQFVVCTTHQLFRYPNAFDLLILDEMDAFPYQGDDVLQATLKSSIRGNYIFMSATMEDAKQEVLTLTKRYHGYDMPVPKCTVCSKTMMYFLLVYKLFWYKRNKLPVLVYVSTIDRTSQVANFINHLQMTSRIVHSKSVDIQESLKLLKIHQIDCIICTTLLERGITIDNVQVIVLDGAHPIYDKQTLLQIAGRVGRKIEHPGGDITIYTTYKTKAILQCIQSIQADNV